jgi:hypothetical protein
MWMRADLAEVLSRRQAAAYQKQRIFITWTLVLLIVAVGAAIRGEHLDEHPFWVDEAESSINAMTILEHGYPTDMYMGIPIYENTHVWFWPDNREYEFRDVSYSDNHLAVYHGWLPLYAIAASFSIYGIEPDRAGGPLLTKHDLVEQKRRTRAARLPAVLFAALFLVVVFLGGQVLYGRGAGWAALTVGAIYPYHQQISNQARYYSAQVTLTTACCVLLWLVIKECRYRHIALAGVSFVLLFHTHLLSFLTAAVMAGISLPIIIHRHRDWLRKLSLFGLVLAAGILPWVIATRFWEHSGRIPRAWPLLRIPGDLLIYPPFRLWNAVPGIMILFVMFLVLLNRDRISASVTHSAKRLVPVVVFLGTWALVGYMVFLLCIPAVSLTSSRLNLSYWGPLFLLASTMSAMVACWLRRRIPVLPAPFVASIVMLALFFLTGHSVQAGPPGFDGSWDIYEDVFQQVDGMQLDSGTRLYATPNSHLVLTFYSGLPIQDMTPVRKSFLDSYRGDIVYIDLQAMLPTDVLAPEAIQAVARRGGYVLSRASAREISMRLRARAYQESMMESFAPGQPSTLEALPAYEQQLLRSHRAQVAHDFANSGYGLVTRGFVVQDWSDWCAVLKYRFVDPNSRRGSHANYVDRLRGADAVILMRSEPIAIYRSPWHPPRPNESLTFRFVE